MTDGEAGRWVRGTSMLWVQLHMDSAYEVGWWTGHALSIAAILGWAAGVVGWLAALAALVWYIMCIYEHPISKRWRDHRRRIRIAHLKAKLAEEFEAEGK